MNTLSPITPEEVLELKTEIIPKEVIAAFNSLIAERWNGYQSIVKQKEVVDLILSKYNEDQKAQIEKDIYSKHWLDIEPIYCKVGWDVVYDKPGYNETYSAYYMFTKSPSRNRL